MSGRKLSEDDANSLLKILKSRFEKHAERHKSVNWNIVEGRLMERPEKLWALNEMEISGGEPDVVGSVKESGQVIFMDCSPESPKGRRSLCYDKAARINRKEHPPKNSAMEIANSMGIEILTEEQYRFLQKQGTFDTKTSSWITTPEDVRNLGGAEFADFRYGKVFIYHNSAESYYAARGFRGVLFV